MNQVYKMNDGNPQGDVFRSSTSEWYRDSQGEKEMAASVPCEGCRNGYGCYNEEQCSNFYASYPPSPTPYGQPMMPYSNNGMADPAPYGQMPPPVNHNPYYVYAAPPPHHQQQFMGHRAHPAQPFYYGQSHAYNGHNGPYYHPSMKAAPYRHQGPRRNSKGYRASNEYTNGAYEESLLSPDVGSDSSSLTFCGIFSEDVRRAVSFVKRNHSATLFQIEGYIAQVAIADDATRRFIQERLKVGSENEQRLGLTAALASFQMLINDEKGSSMLQDFFIYGTQDMKDELMAALYEEGILELSINIHGCRVVQKAIRNIDQKELSKLVAQFQGHVLTMIHDSSGNHVIQRCIQAQSSFAKEAEMAGDMETANEIMDQIQFMITDVVENIETMSIHRYGCRVVQRSIEFCTEKQRNAVLEAITACNESIAEDLYGNYVVQQAIMAGTDMHREQILNTLMSKRGNIFRLSKQKYASNVVEKIMQYGTIEQRTLLLKEILKVHERTGLCTVILMAQDPIANYVVKKAIETAPEGEIKQELLEILSRNRDELLKSPYAKYIVRTP
ncbi:hypothetical protein ACHAXN_004707 [Cyclotella atomus]